MRFPCISKATCVLTLLALAIGAAIPIPADARSEAFTVKDRDPAGLTLQSENYRLFYAVTGACWVFRGDKVHIDTPVTGWPVGARELTKHDIRSDLTCDILHIHPVTKKVPLVRLVIKTNDAIVGIGNNEYLIEYVDTCRNALESYVSQDIWLYQEDELDGVGDMLVLPNGESCAFWSVQNMGPSTSLGSLGPCPPNAHSNPKDLSTCVCDDGYDVNEDMTACVPKQKCPAHASGTWGNCTCNPGYIMLFGSCISFAASCKQVYGDHAVGDKRSCYCEAGYRMNKTKTHCVKNTSNAAKKAEALSKKCGKNRQWRDGSCVPINTCHDSGCAD